MSTVHFGHAIGGLNDLDLPSQTYRLQARNNAFFEVELTDIVTKDGKIFWVTKIRLMPVIETPTYLIVVGEKL